MNAPLFQQELPGSSGTLRLFALFPLNLAYLSIEENQRGEAVSTHTDAAANAGAVGSELWFVTAGRTWLHLGTGDIRGIERAMSIAPRNLATGTI